MIDVGFRSETRLVVFVFCLIFLAVLLSIISDKHLSADGVFYFVSILEKKHFPHFDWSRQLATYITQFPTVLAVSAGLKDIPSLRMIFGMGLLVPWLLAFSLSLLALRNQHKSILLFMLISLLTINLTSDFMLVGEHQVMTVLSWPILFFLLRRLPFQWYDTVSLWALLLCFTMLYPTAIAPASLFVLIAFFRMKCAESRKERGIFLGAILLSIITIGIAALMIIMPRDEGNRGHFILALLKLGTNPELITSVSFLIPFFAGWYFRRPWLVWMAAIPIVVYAIYSGLTGHSLTAYESFENRSLSFVFLPLLMLGAVFINWKKRTLNFSVVAVMLLLTTVMLTANLISTMHWREFRNQVHSVLLEREGLVPIESTGLLDSPASWLWSNSLLSVVWSGRCVQTVILNHRDIDYQPAGPPERFRLRSYVGYSEELRQYDSELCACDSA